MSYRGSGYYKRKKNYLLIAVIISLLLVAAAFAVYFLTECLVFTSDGYRILLPWKDYSAVSDTQPDDGADPVLDIPERPEEPEPETDENADNEDPENAENADTAEPQEGENTAENAGTQEQSTPETYISDTPLS